MNGSPEVLRRIIFEQPVLDPPAHHPPASSSRENYLETFRNWFFNCASTKATAVLCTPRCLLFYFLHNKPKRRRQQRNDGWKVHRQVVHYQCFSRTVLHFHGKKNEKTCRVVYLSHLSILYHLLDNKFPSSSVVLKTFYAPTWTREINVCNFVRDGDVYVMVENVFPAHETLTATINFSGARAHIRWP